MSGSYSGFARRLFQGYRSGPITLGHSLLRRALAAGLATRQEVRLRSGLRLQLDLSKGSQSTIFWLDGNIEVQLYWAIRELLPLGGVFVDCGANCGLMGLLARQYRQARVLFVEPHPRLAKTIEANIQLNGFTETCQLAQCAVSDQDGEVDFYENLSRDGAHSIHKDWAGGMREFGKVKCATLAGLLAEHALTKVHFLKVDTEGNDLAVLRGAGSWLRPQAIELIYVEMSRDRELIRALLEANGYVGFVNTLKNQREVAKRRKDYERGGRACFFTPLRAGPDRDQQQQGEVLWCPKGSEVEACLRELAQTDRDARQ
jgi:FkbM family methyltransferase